jgi:hypothetical protein
MTHETIHLAWHDVPPSDPAERIARALCVHDHLNPDLLVPSGHREPVIAADGIAELAETQEPQWRKYLPEAERYLVALRALAAS